MLPAAGLQTAHLLLTVYLKNVKKSITYLPHPPSTLLARRQSTFLRIF